MPKICGGFHYQSVSVLSLRSFAFCRVIVTALSLVCLASCSSPFVEEISGGRSLTLRVNTPSFLPSVSEGALPDSDKASARLLLPTANSITIRLIPGGGGAVLVGGPSPVVDGSATVIVRSVPKGTYTIVADATDTMGQVVFSKTSAGQDIGSHGTSISMNLLPAGAGGIAMTPVIIDSLAIDAMPSGTSRSWCLEPASGILAGASLFFPGIGPDTHIYLVSDQGGLLGHHQGANPRFTMASLPPGKPVYLTVYNAGAGVQAASVAQPEYAVTLHRNTASSGTIPTTSEAPAGSTINLPGNTGNLVGPLLRDGIYQRFVGWNTKADGSGLAYTPGQAFTMVADAQLYASFTTDSSAIIKVGPAGGYVFFDRGSYTTDNPEGGNWRYIEAAPVDQSTGVAWGPSGQLAINEYLWAMGAGYTNTKRIVERYPGANYAAHICWNLELNGYSDWYLPSSYELGGDDTNSGGMWEKLYFLRGPQTYPNHGGFLVNSRYWTSTEPNNNPPRAIYQSFETSGSHSTGIDTQNLYRVRAVRRF